MGASTQLPVNRPVEEILADLDFWTGRSKLPLVHEAIERWGSIAPHLLTHLQRVIADPQGYLDEDHDLLPYALVLMAHFRDERAHPLMLTLFGVPGETTYNLLGDMQTTALPSLLLRTCGGSLDGIRELVRNRRADDYVRWAAMETLCLAVVAGLADREETIQFLSGLLTGEEAEAGSDFWNGVANSLCDLYPAAVMDIIRQSYAKGLIHPVKVRIEDFEATLAGGLEEALDKVRGELSWRLPSDIEQLVTMCEDFPDQAIAKDKKVVVNREKKQQRKKKKKIIKTSRRRNR